MSTGSDASYCITTNDTPELFVRLGIVRASRPLPTGIAPVPRVWSCSVPSFPSFGKGGHRIWRASGRWVEAAGRATQALGRTVDGNVVRPLTGYGAGSVDAVPGPGHIVRPRPKVVLPLATFVSARRYYDPPCVGNRSPPCEHRSGAFRQ